MSNLQPTGPAQLALHVHPALLHRGSSSASHGLTQPKVHNHYLAPSVLLNLYGLKPGHGEGVVQSQIKLRQIGLWILIHWLRTDL